MISPNPQWERTPRSLFLVLAVVVVVVVIAVRVGVPYLATAIADRFPMDLVTRMTEGVLSALDAEVFAPSQLPVADQRRLLEQFERLRPRGESADGSARQPPYRVVFRRSDQIGPNAMALPSGTIVVTDALVRLADDDREVLGTLAHEAGHVARRHTLRLVLQGSLAALAVGWVIGDFSGVMAGAPTKLLQAKYSRDFEREADAYAADLLRANGISPSYLARMLERLEAADKSGGGGAFDYLASHPATEERLRELRK